MEDSTKANATLNKGKKMGTQSMQYVHFNLYFALFTIFESEF